MKCYHNFANLKNEQYFAKFKEWDECLGETISGTYWKLRRNNSRYCTFCYDKCTVTATAATTAPIQSKPVNNQHLCQERIDGIPESKSNKRAEIDQHEKELNVVLNLPEETPTIEPLQRHGKTRPDDKARPHTLLLTLKSNRDARRILSKSNKLNDYAGRAIYLSRGLMDDERNKNYKILRKRRELIEKGVERSKIKIRSFKLFVDS